jgi:hypothetical protein
VSHYRKELRLPKRFTEYDRKELRSLVNQIWQQIGHEFGDGGIHWEDFAMDAMLHQIDSEVESYPAETAKIARDAEWSQRLDEAKRIRDELCNGDVAEDVLKAYTDFDDPDHRWAMSVCCMRAKEMSYRGKMQ